MDLAMAKCEVIIEEIMDTDFVLFDVTEEEEDSLIDITNTSDDVYLSDSENTTDDDTPHTLSAEFHSLNENESDSASIPAVVEVNRDKENNSDHPSQSQSSKHSSSGVENIIRAPDSSRSRRKLQPEKWARNILHSKVLTGETHTNQKGRTVSQKTAEYVNCECMFNCTQHISEQHQRIIFDQYRAINSRQEQRNFLAKLLVKRPVKRRRIDEDDRKVAKNQTAAYHLKDASGELIRVCQRFFVKTFGISTTVPRNILARVTPSSEVYNAEHKNKGKSPWNKVEDCRISELKSFIKSIPKVSSHYCREDSSQLNFYPQFNFYPDLNLAKLYNLYRAKMNDEAVPLLVFSQVLHQWEPKLSFFNSEKDQCTTCNIKLLEKYDLHIKHKEAIYAAKEQDKQAALADPKHIVCADFDLDAVLYLPYCNDSQLYYSHKLFLYNFNIYDSHQNGICYTWDETEGAKSSTEISSCLLDYIKSLPSTVETVTLYCDTCSGPNRNIYVVSALLFAVNSNQFGGIRTIYLKFLESGHSNMECDSIHAAIERQRTNLNLYLPSDYHNIIENARKMPYTVKPCTHQSFYGIRELTKKFIINRKKDTKNSKKIDWLLVKDFCFTRGLFTVKYKYDVTEESYEEVHILRPSVKTEEFQSFQLQKTAYNARIPISLAKKRDLLKLIKEKIIPPNYSTFYSELPATKDVEDTCVGARENEDDLIIEENLICLDE